ncbi:transcription factor WRKY45-2-like [Phragmites australis]|uniref:transcription factor WRKY45-2-like n=1 Tax=Phragmites australis TaxID=29695 RepID=UPI002D7956A1|nr:transcription factor WRKY45-2-like [Phragmites australis]
MAAAPYARVMEEMFKAREFTTQLQGLLRDKPEAGLIVDQILHAFSRAIDTAKAAAGEEGSEVQSDVTCAVGGGGGGKRKAASSGGEDRRSACRRRTQQSSVVMVTMKDMDDGHAWRKYGQKEIQNSKYPKAYFRCTHKYDQQCAAQRQVQRCEEDPDTYRVTYIGVHTCRDPAAVAPLVVHTTSVADDLHGGSRLISFTPTASATGASAATTSTTTTTTANTNQKDTVLLGSAGLRPLKLEVGDQEEVLSSLTPAGSSAAAEAMRNAAATPGPDQGDVTSGLQHCYDGGVDIASLIYDDVFNLGDILFGFDHEQGHY